MECKSTTYWNVRFLEQFIQENCCPMGLRVQIFPNLRNIDNDFKNNWERNLLTCSREEYNKTLASLNKEIDDLFKHSNVPTHSLFKDKDVELSQNKGTSLKDKMAFCQGTAFKWQSAAQRFWPPKYKKRNI